MPTLLTSQRNTPFQDGRKRIVVPVEAATLIYLGAMVAVDDNGLAVPAQAKTGSSPLTKVPTVIGRADHMVNAAYPGANADNSLGAASVISIEVGTEIAKYDNDSSITEANLGQAAVVIDDHTVGTGLTAVAEGAVTTPISTLPQILDAGHRNLSRGTVLLQNNAKSTTYVEGTDYAVDYANGLIFLLSAAVTGGAATLQLGYSYIKAESNPVAGRIVEVDSDGVWVDFLNKPSVVVA